MCCYSGHKGVPQTSHNFQTEEWGNSGDCTCPGTDDLGCCGYATQKDGLCDRCRIHCGDVNGRNTSADKTDDNALPDDGSPIEFPEGYNEPTSMAVYTLRLAHV